MADTREGRAEKALGEEQRQRERAMERALEEHAASNGRALDRDGLRPSLDALEYPLSRAEAAAEYDDVSLVLDPSDAVHLGDLLTRSSVMVFETADELEAEVDALLDARESGE